MHLPVGPCCHHLQVLQAVISWVPINVVHLLASQQKPPVAHPATVACAPRSFLEILAVAQTSTPQGADELALASFPTLHPQSKASNHTEALSPTHVALHVATILPALGCSEGINSAVLWLHLDVDSMEISFPVSIRTQEDTRGIYGCF